MWPPPFPVLGAWSWYLVILDHEAEKSSPGPHRKGLFLRLYYCGLYSISWIS